MAEARREYQAIFAIGAKLEATFRSTMTAAQARLRSLEATAKKVNSAFKLVGLGLGTLGGLFASFAAAGIIRKLFGGAAEMAIEANQRTRKLTASLMQFTAISAKGPDFAAKQVKLLRQSNEELAKHQIYQEEILDSATAQAAVMGIPPKEIQRMVPAMANILAVSKGVKATTEDSAHLASAWGSAIRTGMVLARKTLSATLPTAHLVTPDRPWLAMTMMSQGFFSAKETMDSAGSPVSTLMFVDIPLASSLLAVL